MFLVLSRFIQLVLHRLRLMDAGAEWARCTRHRKADKVSTEVRRSDELVQYAVRIAQRIMQCCRGFKC